MVKEVLKEELKKQPDENTTVEIRLFEHKTGKAFYKQLTQVELLHVLKSFTEFEWY